MIVVIFTKNNPATERCDCQYESGKMMIKGEKSECLW